MQALDESSLTHLDKEQQTLKEQYERDGFVVIRNAIPKPEIENIRSSLLNRMQNLDHPGVQSLESNFVYEIIQLPPPKAVMMDCFVNAPETLNLLCNESTVSALKTLLGDNFVVLPDTNAHWEYFNVLHTDTTTAEQRKQTFHLEDNYRIVIVAFYLQDNSPEYGGGMYLVPSSNHKPDPYIRLRQRISKIKKSKLRQLIRALTFKRFYNYENEMVFHPEGIDVPHQAGDVIIADMRIIHRSSLPLLKNGGPNGGKIAVYAHVSSDNEHVHNYKQYIMTKMPHLHDDNRNPLELQKRCSELGFQAL